jgi:DNA polymerase-3 subunit alpha
MVAVLSAAAGNADKVSRAVAECRRIGIAALRPDVNLSDANFTPERVGDQMGIRFGLAAIKNIGNGPIESIIAARDGGFFRSVDDFAQRVDFRNVNKRAMESLIKAGALDDLGRRSQLLDVLDRIIGIGQQAQRANEVGQVSLFDFLSDDALRPGIALAEKPEVPQQEKLAWEKELMGLYVSEHPMQRAALQLRDTVTAFCGEIGEELIGQKVTVAGMITSVRQLTTKKRDEMAVATVEDLHGSIDVVVFPRVYQKTKACWQQDGVLIVQGKVDQRGDGVQIVCDAAAVYEAVDDGVTPTNELPALSSRGLGQATAEVNGVAANDYAKRIVSRRPRHLILTFGRSADVDRDLDLLRTVYGALQRHGGGEDSVELSITTKEHDRIDVALPDFKVRIAPDLERQLVELLGPDAVHVEPAP